MLKRCIFPLLIFISCVAYGELTAGAAKVDITDRDAGPVNDPLFAKALVLRNDASALVIITVDAVALGEIGRIGNDFVPTVRGKIEQEFGIKPANVLINASHCHGLVCADIAERTVLAVRDAAKRVQPVVAGAGVGHEDRVSENRRMKLKNGREADARHAYAMPWDSDVAGIGPVDPEIGVLRLDGKDGKTVAVVYNFAVHPIQGVPSGANTADLSGFASQVIEDNLNDGAVALFLQGCAGDINPVTYKTVGAPRDAEPLGNKLGLSTLKAVRKIECKPEERLVIHNETLALPRADTAKQIAAMEAERLTLLDTLQGTSLNFKTFVPLYVQYSLSPEYPSYYSHGYLREEQIGRTDLKKMDETNRANMQQYMNNIHTMEELTRLQTNLTLLKKHQADNAAAEKKTVDVELMSVRIGDFVLLTFPGELTCQTGLDIKKNSPHDLTFVAGYTNGYIYYTPTAEQLCNVGGAQEDSDCIVAPAWHALYEAKAAEMLRGL